MLFRSEVFARKLFHAPTIWAYDISRFLYGALFMLGAGYALSKGVHIRADFLYRNFKTKNQGTIDFWLYILFYFPGLIVFLYMTIGYVARGQCAPPRTTVFRQMAFEYSG